MEEHGVREFLRRCASAWHDADWDELVRRYGPRLASRVRRRLHRCGVRADDGLAEEMLQEVYCRLLEARGRRLLACRGRNEDEVLAYLGRLADRVVIDQVRQLRAVTRGYDRVVSDPAPSAPLAAEPVDPGRSPEDRVLARDGLRRLLARLRATESGVHGRRNLQVLLLSVLGGWTSREIAILLAGDLGPSGVDSLLNRVKRRLRRCCPEAA